MAFEAPVKKNLIGGVWREGNGAARNTNPSDIDDVVGLFAQATPADVADAVESATSAGDNWWRSGSQGRADFLDRVAIQLFGRRDEIARVLAREEGKTLPEALAEVVRAGNIFRFFAGEAVRMSGTSIESVRSGVDVDVRREPVGVVGLITPWNFPIAIPAWKIAPALAYGNTVVIKPPDLTPACVHLLSEIFVDCGLPPGVFNLVMGRGRTIGQALIEHPGVRAVSFTGSVEVGRSIIAAAGGRQLRVQAEMGGKNATVILADADLDAAIPTVINSAFGATGQRCTATSRLIVERGIASQVAERLVTAMRDLRVGHALDPTTNIGPVVSESQLAGNLRYVRLAREEGATVVGGEVVERATSGYFQAPALFLNASNHMRIAREEIFGPCLSVIVADDFDEALTVANDSEFGLSAGICTTSLKYSREFMRRARAGLVMVNLPTAGVDYHVPFGGTRGSSYGPREQGRGAIEFYTQMKTAYVKA